MKKTPLYEKHIQLNAKMVPFSGWEMPLNYSEGIIKEHYHTRREASIFDTCHMGEFKIKGDAAAEILDKIFPRAVANQKVGSARYNFLLTDRGTVIDDLLIYRMAEDEFFLVVNAGTTEKYAERLNSLLPKDILFEDISKKIGKIDLQGPKSANIMEKLCLKKISDLPKNYRWRRADIDGIDMIISRTGYTGELGFEFYLDAEKTKILWDKLLEFPEVKPAGLGARDTLRLEVGYPLYGNEMDEDTTPIEAGFSKIIGIDKRDNFIGSKILKDPKHIKKVLVGIALEGRRAARHGDIIMDKNRREIGYVTSGMFSPILKKAIALGYIYSDKSQINFGDELFLSNTKKPLIGRIVELPFYKNGTVR